MKNYLICTLLFMGPLCLGQVENRIKTDDYSADRKGEDAAAFRINIEKTGFTFVKYMSGSLIYSTDGKIPTEKPTFIVSTSLTKFAATNKKEFAVDRIKKLPRGEFTTIRQISHITIDGLRGYEIVAEGTGPDDRIELIYQAMLFNNHGDYYYMLGRAKEELDRYKELFRKIAASFKLR